MFQRVEVNVEESDRLNRVRWVFIYFERDHRLHLDVVCKEGRPSTRHKYKALDIWSRLDNRGSTMERPATISPSVTAHAKRLFCDSLTIDGEK